MSFVRVVNMIPFNQSGETNQDSEPNLAVNPQRPTDMVGTALTPAPALPGGGVSPFAPIYVSTDGGENWSLRNVIPGGQSTSDVTVAFATTGGMLYAAILSQATTNMFILRTPTFSANTPMTAVFSRPLEDQPWVVAESVVVNGRSVDRVYVGNRDAQPREFVGAVAAIDVSQDAATAPVPAGFTETALGLRRGPFSLPPTRPAVHPDGTVYVVFMHCTRAYGDGNNYDFEVVVRRDDNWGSGPDPFSALREGSMITPGVRVAGAQFARFNAIVGQERIGADLAIAVHPLDSSTVYVSWCDRFDGVGGTGWRLNVARSTDRGANWTIVYEVRPIAKNPSLAINGEGRIGLAYQQLTGGQWITRLEVTSTAWETPADTKVLHQAPANVPVAAGVPYIGDYMRLLAVGNDFYGVFSGNNTPDLANFPSGVRYQRGANWVTKTLLNTNGVTPVAISIDPFFFHWSRSRVKPYGESKPGLTKAESDTPPKSIKSEIKEVVETKPGVTKAELDTPPKSVKSETKEVGESKPGIGKPELDLPPKGISETGAGGAHPGVPDPLAALLLKLSKRIDALEGARAPHGRAFIQPSERPDLSTPRESDDDDDQN
jgi:hypothetical protein